MPSVLSSFGSNNSDNLNSIMRIFLTLQWNLISISFDLLRFIKTIVMICSGHIYSAIILYRMYLEQKVWYISCSLHSPSFRFCVDQFIDYIPSSSGFSAICSRLKMKICSLSIMCSFRYGFMSFRIFIRKSHLSALLIFVFSMIPG